ncbi:HTH-type transcriptional regulator GltR [Peptococcaceae bacterium CEB3]|nr:HTH-type transcriptional regulator GltR [Peptococcaceae bacterium CEB3]
MELHQLRIFLAVAEESSFTRAAEKLGYVQSNISGQVRVLEGELDTKLFERLGKRVALTSDGEKLVRHAKKLLRYAAETKEEMSRSSLPNGTIRIGIAESLLVFRLPWLFREYGRLYPQVKLVIQQGTSVDLRQWLRDNTIDVAFELDNVINDADLLAQILCEEQMVIVAGHGHCLVRKGTIEPEDIRKESFIFTEQGCSYRSAMEVHLSKLDIRPYSSYEVDSVGAIKQLVASRLGIALLPRVAVETELVSERIIALGWSGPKIEMFTQVIYHKNKWISPALASLLDLVEKEFPYRQFPNYCL